MGCSTESIISWGFIIPPEKFPALLQAFRAHDQQRSETPDADDTHTDRLCDEDVAELSEHIDAVLEKGGYYEHFEFVMSGMTDDGTEYNLNELGAAFLCFGEYLNGHTTSGYIVSRRGRENYGSTCRALPVPDKDVIMGDADTREELEKLKKDLHLEEAGVEVEEKWVQTVQIL